MYLGTSAERLPDKPALIFAETDQVVQLCAGREASAALEEELSEHVRARIARFKAPRSVDFVADLPRQENGKIYKRLLRDRYWLGHGSKLV